MSRRFGRTMIGCLDWRELTKELFVVVQLWLWENVLGTDPDCILVSYYPEGQACELGCHRCECK
jgi:hypothetical protein